VLTAKGRESGSGIILAENRNLFKQKWHIGKSTDFPRQGEAVNYGYWINEYTGQQMTIKHALIDIE
jgi:hypothetical protein